MKKLFNLFYVSALVAAVFAVLAPAKVSAEASKEDAKVISVSDLKIDGNLVGDSLLLNEQKNMTYDNDDHKTNYSLIFKFKYEVVELKQNQFHLSTSADKWENASSFILVNGGTRVHVGKSTATEKTDGWSDDTYKFEVGKLYDIEFGRVANLNDGEFAGTYHVYIKINGELIKEYPEMGIPQEIVSGNVVFTTADGHNKIYDMTYVGPDTYEKADIVTISDLTVGGNAAGKEISLEEGATYDFTSTAAHKSVIFKFTYVANNAEAISEKAQFGPQIHFADGWAGFEEGGMVWLRADKIFLQKPDKSYLDSGKQVFTKVGEYDVEIGKLYVESGNNAGKFLVYVSVNGERLVELIDPEMDDVSKIFITGAKGDSMKEVVIADEYEKADVISIADLKAGENPSKYEISLEEGATYDFTSTAAHKSVIFKFKYVANNATAIADKTAFGPQIHFADGWDGNDEGGMVWLRANKIYLQKADASYFETEGQVFTEVGEYDIEIGKLYVESGKNAGKFLVYVSVNGERLLEEIDPEMDNVAKVFITGAKGDSMKDVFGADTYEEADIISISDLTLNGKAVGKELPLEEQKTYDYEAKAEHKSVIFKAIFEVNNATAAAQGKDNAGPQIHFADGWGYSDKGGMVWLRYDKFFLQKPDGKYYDTGKQIFTETKDYNVEFGKLYIASGRNAGKYYFYLKVDGELLLENMQDETAGVAKIFFTTSKGDRFKDIYPADEYETADVVSIKDLTLEGEAVGSSLTLSAQTIYAYNATAEHKSVKFIFSYVVADPSNVSCQIHFKDGWLQTGGMLWLRNDGFFLQKADGKYLETGVQIFKEAKEYQVEFGKLYVTAGKNTGKCLVYVKVADETIFEYVCAMPEDANIFFTGTNGDVLKNICVGGHELTHVEAKDATCTVAGNSEHWVCDNCGVKFSDDKGTTEVADVVIPAHTQESHVAAKAPTCDYEGNIEYWVCSCGKKYSDEARTQEVTDAQIVLAPAHDLTHNAANAPTCEEDGNIEYWHCSECGKNFDANGKALSSVVDPASGHNYEKGSCVACGAKDPNYKGCGGVVSATGIITLLAAAAFLFRRRKENE